MSAMEVGGKRASTPLIERSAEGIEVGTTWAKKFDTAGEPFLHTWNEVKSKRHPCLARRFISSTEVGMTYSFLFVR